MCQYKALCMGAVEVAGGFQDAQSCQSQISKDHPEGRKPHYPVMPGILILAAA